MIIRVIGSVVLAAALLCLGASAALGHGETVKTDPKKNATLSAVPQSVSVDLSEPPTNGSLLEVTDGCARNVAAHVTAEGNRLVAHIDEAQPGEWKAAYQIVSAADGHPSDGSWTFTVEGEATCGEDESTTGTPAATETPAGDSGDVSESEDTESVAGTPASDSDEGSFPLIPVVGGAIAVLGAAVLVRAKTS